MGDPNAETSPSFKLVSQLLHNLQKRGMNNRRLHRLASSPQLLERVVELVENETLVTVDYGQLLAECPQGPGDKHGTVDVSFEQMRLVSIREMTDAYRKGGGVCVGEVDSLVREKGLEGGDLWLGDALIKESKKIPDAWRSQYPILLPETTIMQGRDCWMGFIAYDRGWYRSKLKFGKGLDGRARVLLLERS